MNIVMSHVTHGNYIIYYFKANIIVIIIIIVVNVLNSPILAKKFQDLSEKVYGQWYSHNSYRFCENSVGHQTSWSPA
jgi:hypothetical protein